MQGEERRRCYNYKGWKKKEKTALPIVVSGEKNEQGAITIKVGRRKKKTALPIVVSGEKNEQAAITIKVGRRKKKLLFL